MSADADLAEADRVPGAPHPRFSPALIGHSQALDELLSAARDQRLHHAWLIGGARGIGKATFAWTAAKRLLSDDPDAQLDGAALSRIHALSEPRLHLVRRPVDPKTGRISAQTTVDEVRKLTRFFHLSSAEGGRRVAIIDAADDLNVAAANALLKLLEEPPRDAVIFLISHQPARLLPTIRSRCRQLRLAPLTADEIVDVLAQCDAADLAPGLAALSEGSAGAALVLAGQDGLSRYRDLVGIFAEAPHIDRTRVRRWAEAAAPRAGAEGDPFDLSISLLERFLVRLARAGLTGPPLPEAVPGEGETMQRLCPDAMAARIWADALGELGARVRTGRALNLDPVALLMDMLLQLAALPPMHMRR